MSLSELAVKYALRLGASEAHSVESEGEVIRVEVERDTISSVSYGRSSSLSLAVITGNRIGFSSMKNPTEESIKLLAERGYELAKALKPNPYWKGLPKPKPYPHVEGLYDRKISELGVEEAVELMKTAVSIVKDRDSRVSVVNGTLSVSSSNRTIANSEGIYCEERFTTMYCGLLTVAKEGGEVGSFAYEDHSSRRMDLDIENLAIKAAEKALASLRPKTLKSFKGTVIFDPDVSRMLFSALSAAYNGLNIWRGISPLKGRLGEKIATEQLTIVDDGVRPWGLASSKADGEGSPRRTTVVIEDGILKAFINNTFTARLLNMEETGNAAGLLDVAPSNTVVKPGDYDVEEMVCETDVGLYVGRLSGHIRFEDGLISGTAKQAFLIKNGERRYPVTECMISGNLYDILKNITGLSREVEVKWSTIVPTVMVENVSIIGGGKP
ncbi:TldD/PmbA family protein [Candidatus Bathyarchaeota archaeon]|nr:TldD/PmbA family protein [Candidatus Bathyarchaeota archaeon]